MPDLPPSILFTAKRIVDLVGGLPPGRTREAALAGTLDRAVEDAIAGGLRVLAAGVYRGIVEREARRRLGTRPDDGSVPPIRAGAARRRGPRRRA